MLAKKLKKGDTIGIIAPSKPMLEIEKKELDNFKEYMNSIGFNIKDSKNLYKIDKYNSSGGTPKERADDINAMFEDNEIKAIWCAQGGDTANQTIEYIDFDIIKNNPKLFLGKSDIDLLHLAINKKTGLKTIHCCDPKIGRKREMDIDYNKEWFKKRLMNGEKDITPTEEWKTLRKGECEGRLIGCNTSSMLKLAGTPYSPDYKNCILFIESYNSSPKKAIKQLTQFKMMGVFDEINGIVLVSNFKYDDKETGYTFPEIVLDICKDYNFPIIQTNEFGHYQPHAFYPIGTKIKVDANNNKIKIIEDFIE